jgi:hypothetical protein
VTCRSYESMGVEYNQYWGVRESTFIGKMEIQMVIEGNVYTQFLEQQVESTRY